MTADELAALQPGDTVLLRATVSSVYVADHLDDGRVMATLPGDRRLMAVRPEYVQREPAGTRPQRGRR